MSLLDEHSTEGATALDAAAIDQLTDQVFDWSIVDGRLKRQFAFRDFHQTIDFVNALAVMIHQENHHPELQITYRHCTVNYNTHSAGGALSQNDFICAAKADAIYARQAQAGATS